MTPAKPIRDPSLPPTRSDRLARVQFFAAGVLLVGVLYWTRELLIPCALAAFIAFVLAPLVTRLRDLHFPKPIAVTLVTVVASAILITLVGLFVAQWLDLANKLDDYKQNLIVKLEALRPMGKDPITKLTEAVDDLESRIATTQSTVMSGAPPIKAVIVENKPTFLTTLSTLAGRFLTPIAFAGTVFVLVFFLLLESELAEVRLRYLVRRLKLGITDEVIDDTTRRLGSYLRMQLIVNLSYGVMVTLAMWAFGVPNFALWGMSAALLRYVPYLGPLLAAALPITLSVAFFPDWSKPLWITGCFLVAETITNGILEPWLYGRGTGVSSLGVVISAFFWYWLWGPIGIILAMPMTICLVVVGKQIPMVAPLAYLLSGDSRARHRKPEEEPPEPTLFDPVTASPSTTDVANAPSA